MSARIYGTTCRSCGAAMLRGPHDLPICADCTDVLEEAEQ